LANGYPLLKGRFANKLVPGSISFGPELEPLGKRLSGVVAQGPNIYSTGNPYAADFVRHFPQFKYPLGFDESYNGAMEASIEALEEVHGDLSRGERRFRAVLANLRLASPEGGTIRLDRHREAIGPNYLFRFSSWTSGALIERLDGVENTFGGYFKPTD